MQTASFPCCGTSSNTVSLCDSTTFKANQFQERSLYEFVNCQYANGEIVYWQFFTKNILYAKKGERNNLTQAELRELYCKRLEREKQTYVAKATGINGAILSQFKRGKIDLYPHLFSKLESYLINP